MNETAAPILDVRDLAVEFPLSGGTIVPVRGVSFTLAPRQRLGIVGESGSGKSLTALSLMRLLPPPGRIGGGEVLMDGRDLTRLSEREMARVRGGRMALVYQDPMSSLNPVQTVGRQIVEAIRTHEDVSRAAARARAIELLGEVGLPQPAERFDSYPHQFSGGMRQRVMIAMAISAGPDVLIADEPTTALDVTTQARIIDLLGRLVDQHDMAVILITHDLGVAASFCDDVHVMYAGRIVERSPAEPLFRQPVHPYTEALLSAICRLDFDVSTPIAAIPGQPPLPQAIPEGCPFHPRCPHAFGRCTVEVPADTLLPDGRTAECHLAGERAGAEVAA
ncbi:MAG TPA: ABC transporter ATP-binding protein [Gaiellaceae bacterium]|nr:ABC transporter ATP-binding protein [Gaiellaceae bacterium]